MRAAPIGVLFRDSPERMIEVAVEQSAVTHRDPRATAGAVAVAGAAALASARTRLGPREFLDRVADWAERENRTMADAISSVERWLGLPPDQAARRLRGVRLGVGAPPGALLARIHDQGAWRAGDLTKLSDSCARLVRSPS